MPSVQEKIFRSAALARHASPEGLDALLEITTVRGWIALIALSAVVLAGVIWGVLGRIPQVVTGQGIMVSDSGVYRIQAAGAGQIDSMLVNVGDTVRRGQTIAIVAQPEIRTSIRQLEASLAELRANRAATARLLESTQRMAQSSIDQQLKQADEAILTADKRLAYLDARIVNEQGAFARGLLTPDVLQNTIAERAETNLQKLSTIARKQELSASGVQGQVVTSQSMFALDQQIQQAGQRLARDSAQLVELGTVVSTYDGVVLERFTDAGQAISAGTALVTVEPNGAPKVLMFIPLEGKRIRADMPARMVPGGVRPEETGYFLGKVRTVSLAPLSGSALDRYLKNEVLVEQFTSQGGAYMVEVTVERDPTDTVSGFKWTSRHGARVSFGSGTLVSGKIIVEEMRPLALVIPAIRRWLGG